MNDFLPKRVNPAQTTEAATRSLHWGFFALAITCYLVAGLWARAPWKSADLEGLAIILTLLERGDPWQLQLSTLIEAESGPLAWWFGALCVWLLGPWIGEIGASRVPQLFWLLLLLFSVWQSVRMLSSRRGAQPVELPFGGQPSVERYARTLADASGWLLLASVGLVWHSHETSTALPTLSFQALGLMACSRMLDQQKPVSAALYLGLALAGCLLCAGVPGLVPLLFGIVAAVIFVPRLRAASLFALSVSLPTAALIIGVLWAWPLWQLHPETSAIWWQTQWSLMGWPSWEILGDWGQDLPWFWWPLWPLAGYGLWRWRHYLAHAHVALPVVFVASALLSSALIQSPAEAQALAALPALAVLSSLALPTLQRSWRVAFDGFSISVYSVAIALVWLGWIAIATGWPTRIANNFERQTPGFEYALSWPVLLLALGLTLCWVGLAIWRLRSRHAWLLREPLIAAAGLVIGWTLLMSLWLPSLNYARSYEAMALELRTHLPATLGTPTPGGPTSEACISSAGLSRAHHAALKVHAQLDFAPDFGGCAWILLQSTPNQIDTLQRNSLALLGTGQNQSVWVVRWEGQRVADRRERFRLLQREPIIP